MQCRRVGSCVLLNSFTHHYSVYYLFNNMHGTLELTDCCTVVLSVKLNRTMPLSTSI